MGQWCSIERRGVNNPAASDPKRRVSNSSRKSKGNIQVVRNPKHSAASASADDNDGTLVLSSEYDSIILGGSSNSTQSSIHDRRNTEPTIFLLPHQHTLFCERKQRVCTAVGRCQELETLRVSGLEPTKHDWIWFRSSSADIHATKDKKMATIIIPNSENRLEYRLEKGDVNSYIGICYGPVGTTPKFVEDNKTDRHIVSNTVGPVLPGPPRVLEFTVGGDLRVGAYAKANVTYIGGTEGRSEYWWMRITGDGKRTQITEPKATPDPSNNRAFGDSKEDSRFYLVKPEDLGCTLKAKCRPIRVDGAAGEIFTSKSSVVVVVAAK